jgi:6-pyruvoyltetrahydropterin/6-carboxytetrahydropterin synthase
MYQVRVEEEFSAAHYLSHYRGKCERLHGHNYLVRVWLSGDKLDEGGMLFDFSSLKKTLREVLAVLDHKNLNDLEIFNNDPSAERIAKFIFEEIQKKLPDQKAELLWAVDVFENSKSMVRYSLP